MSHQPYEETTLAAILEGFDSIDKHDPYQVYCLFMLIDAECVRCGATIDFAELTSAAASPEWCDQAAQLMRRLGWFVPEANNSWHFIEAYCPRCGFDPLPDATPIGNTPFTKRPVATESQNPSPCRKGSGVNGTELRHV